MFFKDEYEFYDAEELKSCLDFDFLAVWMVNSYQLNWNFWDRQTAPW